jgi:hypothetical protein
VNKFTQTGNENMVTAHTRLCVSLKWMRPLAVLFLSLTVTGLTVACGGQTKPEPEPEPQPSENLFALETTPTKTDFVVIRGSTAVLEVRSKIFSPSVKKVKVVISGSTGASIDPKEITLDGNSSAKFNVMVPDNIGGLKPFFRVEGSARDERGNPITANPVSILFQWDATPPPLVK